jgi:hypothetical protein
MADHQGDAGLARRLDDLMPLFHRGCDRFFDQHMNPATDQGQRDLVVEMGRRSDGHGVDPGIEQLVDILECPAADQILGARPVCRKGIDDPGQGDARQAGQHPGMIAAHHPGPDHADTEGGSCARRHVRR